MSFGTTGHPVSEPLAVGDYIRVWHDTGARGATPVYARIVKLNRVTVDLRTEAGDIRRAANEFARTHRIQASEWHPEINGERPTTGQRVRAAR